MKIIEKICAKSENIRGRGPITLAFFGDSVTQGCFEVYTDEKGSIQTIYDSQYAYHSMIKNMLALLYPGVPVNIINAGISGDNAKGGLERIDRDVMPFCPDLTVVAFGLNDSCQGLGKTSVFEDSLGQIFKRLRTIDTEIIYMTPNMMNTKISCDIKDDVIRAHAKKTMDIQNGGVLDAYVEAAKDTCREYGVTICDCYAKWKQLFKSGVDITSLLSNRINHPTREMNTLFAVSLLETMFNQE